MGMLTLIIMIKGIFLPDSKAVCMIMFLLNVASFHADGKDLDVVKIYGKKASRPRFINCGVLPVRSSFQLPEAVQSAIETLFQSRLDLSQFGYTIHSIY